MVGYRKIRSSDPEEQRLRDEWDRTAALAEGTSEGSPERQEHLRVRVALEQYVWTRTLRIVEEDRKRHPKAKRNQLYKRGEEQ